MYVKILICFIYFCEVCLFGISYVKLFWYEYLLVIEEEKSMFMIFVINMWGNVDGDNKIVLLKDIVYVCK